MEPEELADHLYEEPLGEAYDVTEVLYQKYLPLY